MRVRDGSPTDHARDRRDLRVLALHDQGLRSAEIARRVGISDSRVRSIIADTAEVVEP